MTGGCKSSLTRAVTAALAGWAKDGGPLREEDSTERPAASHAGLAGPAIDGVALLEGATRSRGISIVPQCRAPGVDRLGQNLANARRHAVERLGCEVARRHAWVEFGSEEDLIGVDVSDPCDRLLIEQGGLQGATPAAKGIVQLATRDGQGIGPEGTPA